jgi:uncharacterized cupin superfamily protein
MTFENTSNIRPPSPCPDTMAAPLPRILVERDIPPTRQAELGVHGWPVWKDGEGSRVVTLDADEKSYFLAGSATLTPAGGAPVMVNKGDLVTVPAGSCRWDVHAAVRRHYRSEALSPACCIV